jgi:Holliday junction resolvase-like predicted endonuclease
VTAQFQGDASRFGKAYETHVAQWLEQTGFTITGRNVRHESGVEFDIVATSWNGDEVGIECKASPDSATSPGMVRPDNRWKVLGYLYALNVWKQRTGRTVRYVLITSHMPQPGTEQRRLLDFAELLGDLQIVVYPNPIEEQP